MRRVRLSAFLKAVRLPSRGASRRTALRTAPPRPAASAEATPGIERETSVKVGAAAVEKAVKIQQGMIEVADVGVEKLKQSTEYVTTKVDRILAILLYGRIVERKHNSCCDVSAFDIVLIIDLATLLHLPKIGILQSRQLLDTL